MHGNPVISIQQKNCTSTTQYYESNNEKTVLYAVFLQGITCIMNTSGVWQSLLTILKSQKKVATLSWCVLKNFRAFDPRPLVLPPPGRSWTLTWNWFWNWNWIYEVSHNECYQFCEYTQVVYALTWLY